MYPTGGARTGLLGFSKRQEERCGSGGGLTMRVFTTMVVVVIIMTIMVMRVMVNDDEDPLVPIG